MELLKKPPRIVNIGLARFARPLTDKGLPVVHVDWKPPAAGNAEMLRLLERLGR